MKYFLGILTVGAVLGAIAFFGLSPFGKTIVQSAFGSAAGTTYNDAKVAAIVWNPQSNAASSTSILNSDAGTRYITDSFIVCNNFGTSPATNNASAVTVQIATTTTSANGLQGNTNYAGNFTFSTSTLVAYTATSTEGVITGTSRAWPTSTYLTFNMSATSTAGTCTVGAHYVGS
jgi:hypothetical protein